jgi:hypothetical protein
MARKERVDPVVITDAPEDPERELRHREIRYVAMMLVRVLCLIGAAALVAKKPPLWGLWAAVLAIAAIIIPWVAVVLANDRPPRKRAPAPPKLKVGEPQALEQREHKIIDHD